MAGATSQTSWSTSRIPDSSRPSRGREAADEDLLLPSHLNQRVAAGARSARERTSALRRNRMSCSRSIEESAQRLRAQRVAVLIATEAMDRLSRRAGIAATRTHAVPMSRYMTCGIVPRAWFDLTPEFLMTGAETARRFVAMKVTGEPELAAVKENLHWGSRRAH